MSKEIVLTRGMKAIVDDEDYDAVSSMKWHVQVDSRGKIYSATDVLGSTVYLHRFLMGDGCDKVDHINGNTLDNRRCNLRNTSTSENAMNNKKTNAPRSSKYKGVTHTKDGKWKAHIGKDDEDIHIGYFDSEEEAAKAYDAKAKTLFGDKARINFT